MLSMLLAMLETEEDRERFLKLHGTYEKKLYAVAVRVLGDRTAAEDAVQQTWCELIRRWDRVSGLAWSETEGYLVTAVKNVAVDMLRKERREEALPEDSGSARSGDGGDGLPLSGEPDRGRCRRATGGCWS